MNYIDIVILGALLLGVISGIWSGFIKQAATCAALVLGVLFGWAFAGALGAALAGAVSHPLAAKGLAFALIFVAVGLVVQGIGWLMRKELERWKLESSDRLLGGVLGFFKGLLIAVVFCAVLPFVGTRESRPQRAQELETSMGGWYLMRIGSLFMPAQDGESVHDWAKRSLAELAQKVGPRGPHGTPGPSGTPGLGTPKAGATGGLGKVRPGATPATSPMARVSPIAAATPAVSPLPLLTATATPGPDVIRVGMAWPEARRRLAAVGSRDISATVGIMFAAVEPEKIESAWYQLPDETGLCVIYGIPPAEPVVASLELGEKGVGYGDKMMWVRQQKTQPGEINLAEFRKPAASPVPTTTPRPPATVSPSKSSAPPVASPNIESRLTAETLLALGFHRGSTSAGDVVYYKDRVPFKEVRQLVGFERAELHSVDVENEMPGVGRYYVEKNGLRCSFTYNDLGGRYPWLADELPVFVFIELNPRPFPSPTVRTMEKHAALRAARAAAASPPPASTPPTPPPPPP